MINFIHHIHFNILIKYLIIYHYYFANSIFFRIYSNFHINFYFIIYYNIIYFTINYYNLDWYINYYFTIYYYSVIILSHFTKQLSKYI